MTEELRGQENWTQLVYSRTKYEDGLLVAVPLRNMGRLEAMSSANALIEIPEGCTVIKEDTLTEAWFFNEKNML